MARFMRTASTASGGVTPRAIGTKAQRGEHMAATLPTSDLSRSRWRAPMSRRSYDRLNVACQGAQQSTDPVCVVVRPPKAPAGGERAGSAADRSAPTSVR
jgi:hypothetical protein